MGSPRAGSETSDPAPGLFFAGEGGGGDGFARGGRDILFALTAGAEKAAGEVGNGSGGATVHAAADAAASAAASAAVPPTKRPGSAVGPILPGEERMSVGEMIFHRRRLLKKRGEQMESDIAHTGRALKATLERDMDGYRAAMDALTAVSRGALLSSAQMAARGGAEAERRAAAGRVSSAAPLPGALGGRLARPASAAPVLASPNSQARVAVGVPHARTHRPGSAAVGGAGSSAARLLFSGMAQG